MCIHVLVCVCVAKWYMYIHSYMYIHTHIHTCICIYMYMHLMGSVASVARLWNKGKNSLVWVVCNGRNAGCSFFATDTTGQRWFWPLPPSVFPDCIGLFSWQWFSRCSHVAQGYTRWLSAHPQSHRDSWLICPVCLWLCQGCHPMIGLSSPTCPARQWVVLLSACGS